MKSKTAPKPTMTAAEAVATVSKYTGLTTELFSGVPNVKPLTWQDGSGVWAVRIPMDDGVNGDFMVHGPTEDDVEECEFNCWPPVRTNRPTAKRTTVSQ